MQTVTFKVKGMSCMGCVKSVRNVLEPISGVKNVDVSLEQGQVVVGYESGGADRFKAAIEDAGYEVLGQS